MTSGSENKIWGGHNPVLIFISTCEIVTFVIDLESPKKAHLLL